MAPPEDLHQRHSRIRRILEGRILPTLTVATTPMDNSPAPGTSALGGGREAMVDAMLAIALQGREDEAMAEMRALIRAGWSVEDLQVDILAPTALRLGELWDTDVLSFVDVTLATATLHRLMHLAWDTFSGRDPFGHGQRICLFPEPGAEHIFGVAMAARFFDAAGWAVDLVTRPDRTRLVEKARSAKLDAIGLSLTRREMVDPCATLIRSMRDAAANPALLVAGGGPVLAADPDLAEVIGLDVILTDARTAPDQLSDMISARR